MGHSSIRTTALYWRNIYCGGDDNSDIDSILAAKNWLERPEPSQNQDPPKPPPTTENFPETPKHAEPIFIDQKPVVPNKKPIQQNNSLSVPKAVKKTLKISINQTSPSSQEKFSLEKNTNKKSDQLETNQPLALITNKEQKPTAKELILFQKIKQLEEQLKQEKQRADQLEVKLKQISYYQQLDQEGIKTQAQIIQPSPLKTE